jgi:hypothetical protein
MSNLDHKTLNSFSDALPYWCVNRIKGGFIGFLTDRAKGFNELCILLASKITLIVSGLCLCFRLGWKSNENFDS